VSRVVARRGFAAPLAACTLAAVTALAAASFHTVVQARRAATRFRAQEQAASAADLGLYSALGGWIVAARDSLQIGGVDSSVSPADPALVGARVLVTRITQRLFWLDAAAATRAGTSVEASRIHHLLIEVLRPVVPTAAALVARGDVLVGADATIDGTDTPPPGWSGCPPAHSVAAWSVMVPVGVVARDDDGLPIAGSTVDERAARTETYELLGGLSRTELAARADVVLSAGAILSPPRDSTIHPVFYAPGDLAVSGVGGRGVLLVEGRLSVRGPFEFAGVILAGRGIEASGPDVNLYGTVFSAGTEAVLWRGRGAIRRSTCAVDRASNGAARAVVVARRGWAERY
jgi:hypothetical protein